MTRRTILFVDASPVVGGATRVLLDLLRWLDTDEVDAVVVCRAGSAVEHRVRSLGPALVALPLPTLTFAGPTSVQARMAAGWLRAQIAITRVLRERRPVLVHATGLASALLAGLPARRAAVPLVWHAHELLPRSAAMRLAVRAAGRLSRMAICVSEATRGRIVEMGVPAETCRVVHNAIPGSRRGRLMAIGAPPRGSPTVLAMGTLAPGKGHRHLVEAASLLVQAHPDLRVEIAGEVAFARDEAYARDLEADVRARGLDATVRFLGFQEDVPGLLERATILVHPTPEEEAFGLAPLEAMAAGRPVVAARAGGVGEVVEDGVSGILVEPGSGPALAAAVDRLLGDAALRESMGAAGRRIAGERFGGRAMRRGIEAVLAPLAGGPVLREPPGGS